MPAEVLPRRSGEGWNLFSEASQVVLSRWDLTRTALAESWGGPKTREKYNRMVDDLMANCDEQWREGNDLHEDTLDVFLLECLEQDFNVDFEGGDDSVVTEVSLIIQSLYRRCASGDLGKAREIIASLEKMPSMNQGGVRPAGDDSSSDGSGEEGGEEEGGGEEMGGAAGGGGGGGRGPRRVVDEEGWETVAPKKGGKKGGGGGGGGGGGMEEE